MHVIKYIITLIFIFCCWSYFAMAQTVQWYDESNSGIPTDVTRDISIDSDGAKWMTFSAPVVRFASFKDTIWQAFDTSYTFVPGNQLAERVASKKNNLWIIFTKNVVLYRNKGTQTWNKIVLSDSLPVNNFSINSISVDENGYAWIGTTLGIVKLDKGNIVKYISSNTNPILNGAGSVYKDSQEKLWLFTSKNFNETIVGYFHLLNQNWVWFDSTKTGFSWESIRPYQLDIIEGPKGTGTIYVNTTNGVAEYSDGNWSLRTLNDLNIASNNIRSNFVRIGNKIWTGTKLGDLIYKAQDGWEKYPIDLSKQSYDAGIGALTFEEPNLIWGVGTINQGIFRLELPDSMITTSVNQPSTQQNQISVYPVPASHQINFESTFPIDHYKLFSYNGQLIKQGELNSSQQGAISLRGLENGMYHVLFNNSETSDKISRKVVKVAG